MGTEILPSAKAYFDIFPEKKKDNFDRAMDIAHLLMDGAVGAVCNCISSVFQSYAIMQGSREIKKIVRYTNNLEEMRIRAAIEMRRLDIEAQRQWQQYDLQKTTLTLYVDKKFQEAIDQLTIYYRRKSNKTYNERYQAALAVDKYTSRTVSRMDQRYQLMLRQEELACAAYRDALHEVTQSGISRSQVAAEIFKQAIANTDRLSDQKFDTIINAIIKMTEPTFISFGGFVKMHGDLQRGWSNE